MRSDPQAPQACSLAALLGTHGAADARITGLTADSRTVEPGYLFAALPGLKADGRSFIPQALERGASALLVPERTQVEGAAVVEDRRPRRRFAEMAARFYVAQPETVAAITGTNGKTSVASFTRQLWRASGCAAAGLGTLGVESDPVRRAGGLTSPDPVLLHALLAELAKAGVTHAACEASSHGLDQYRLDGVRLAAGAFTNLSRDHLDYHGTEEAYFQAKARLFGELLEPGAPAVITIEDTAGRRMAELARGRRLTILTVGRDETADLQLAAADSEGDAQRLIVAHRGDRHDVLLPLAGGFQAENALLAAGLVIACGGDAVRTIADLAKLEPVPGRLEKVGETAAGGSVFVDYAHTPGGLHSVLRALRPHTAERLVVLFGCGGERDRGKRPEMGRIACELADHAIVTDDNPRGEDAAAIRAEVLAAAPVAEEIGDRGEAIARAAASLQAGDTLVIAGKGHEEGQIVGEEVLPFSDVEAARAAIEESARCG